MKLRVIFKHVSFLYMLIYKHFYSIVTILLAKRVSANKNKYFLE